MTHSLFGRKCINHVKSVDLRFSHGTCDLSVCAIVFPFLLRSR